MYDIAIEEVKQQGYTENNILDYLTASALLLVNNPSSSSTQIRICVDPARPSKSGATVNDSFFPGYPHIPHFANHSLPDHPTTDDDTYLYLGMAINCTDDTMRLKSKPLCLRSRIKGLQDTIIRKLDELKTYFNTSKFTKAHVAAIMHGIFCPLPT